MVTSAKRANPEACVAEIGQGFLGRAASIAPHQLGGLGQQCKLPQCGPELLGASYCAGNTYVIKVHVPRPIFSVVSEGVVPNQWGLKPPTPRLCKTRVSPYSAGA